MEYRIDKNYSEQSSIVYECNDTLKFTKKLPDSSVQLIITSPPYNIGKEYETKVSIEEYLEQQKKTIEELVRVLSPKGSLCWQVGNYIEKGEVYPLDIFYYEIFKNLGLHLRNRIIWHFEHGLHASKRFSGRYETILWFTKEENYTFNLDDIRVPSKYPGKRHYKGEKKGQPSCNPKGKNPSDLWSFVKQEWEKEIWDIPNVKANHVEKTIHPCQYPIELVERCVLALTDENDIVYDPYAGVGSSLIAAIKNGRRAYGVDQSEEYVNAGFERIESLLNGTLKIRPIGKPVYVPTGKEKVAQIPEEWKMMEGKL